MLELLLKGGIMMVPIIIASIVSLTFMLERLNFWRRQRETLSALDVIKEVEAGRFSEAMKLCEANPAPVTRVVKAGIMNRGSGAALAMEAEALSELKEMNRYMPALDTIITLAPLLGLLGTIVGMIDSFGVISDAGLSRPLAVTGGISEALIATAAGILVAVSTLIPHNFFQSRAEKAACDMERYATRVEMALKKTEAATEAGAA